MPIILIPEITIPDPKAATFTQGSLDTYLQLAANLDSYITIITEAVTTAEADVTYLSGLIEDLTHMLERLPRSDNPAT